MWFLPFLALTKESGSEIDNTALETPLNFGRTQGVWYLDKPDHVHPLVAIFDRPLQTKTYRHRGGMAICCVLVGGTVAGLANKQQGLRLFARPHIHLIWTSGVVALAYIFDRMVQRRELRRRVYFKNYVLAHPELFPVYERPKYKDLLQSWHPSR